ncbi:transporter substrate-binding domain-containing protein [Niveibacterium sp. 24ML]|uniref:substrate-binding periplasmic protein n=1 Tax=Niveibacterium sp. 24ML TaxID=2985512 RepID=UPI002271304F|nr:transporter substrate-binding domain-containing protein [Niveibacterium sp. 24ML]MCX9156288.1 transporter substrate-binding domain-containing protein [Niveibacterium sp. 24ML]
MALFLERFAGLIRRCTALLIVALAGQVWAAELALVSGNGYAPYAEESAPGGGTATQRVREAFKQIGMAPRIDWLPWARGYRLTLAGEYAATFPYTRTPERERDFLYSDPIHRLPHFLFGRPDDSRVDEGVDALWRGTLCLPHAWAGPPQIEALIQGKRIAPERPERLSACIRMVLLGRADLVVATPELLSAALREAQLAPDTLRRGKGTLGELSLHLIAPRNQPGAEALIRRFNQALAKLPPQ